MDQDFKYLTELHACVKENKPLPDNLNQWLLSGFERLSTGKAKTLDESLSLEAKPGFGTVGNRLQKTIRDSLIIKLVSLDTESRSQWAAAKKASQELNKFYRRKLSIVRRDEERRSEKDKILLKIFEIDGDTPTSEGFIYFLMKDPRCFY